tara:strand:- start:62 stop:484 length:423 start_codon:yes stop_codon:yes gene_type:complete
MKNLLEKLDEVCNQTFNAAIITDSKGQQQGKVLVRYTKGKSGYSRAEVGGRNETGVLLNHKDISLDFNKSIKGDWYEKAALYTLLTEAGCKLLDHSKREYYDYHKNPGKKDTMIRIDRMFSCTQFKYIKKGNSLFTIHWI